MTIGMAAYGPRAGRAILAGLALAETIGRGAIGGFVSLAVIGDDGRLHRAETQDGGGRTLFAGERPPAWLDESACAVLMSSGPRRPPPLAQFTPGDPEVGLVTGHRFPHMPGRSGLPVNVEILGLMRAGAAPSAAVEQVLGDNPEADAGIIALSKDGLLHAQNTRYVSAFHDAGQAALEAASPSCTAVAVLHNAIRPWRGLASVIAAAMLDVVNPPAGADATAHLRAGTTLAVAGHTEIHVDASHDSLSVSVRDARYLSGTWHIGLGPRAPIVRDGRVVGNALYEPFLVITDGVLSSIDGQQQLALPISIDIQI